MQANQATAAPEWSVADLGRGLFQFRWPRGYLSPFLITADGVVAVDPIDDLAAAAYRQAIASVSDAPVVAIIYSHEHLDHCAGAGSLAPAAEIIAHRAAAERLANLHPGIAPVTRVLAGGESLHFGDHVIDVHYPGPSHGAGNILLSLDCDAGRFLLAVDIAEPNFRGLPDTDIAGFRQALHAAVALAPDVVSSGHTRGNNLEWLTVRRDWIDALCGAVEVAWHDAARLRPAAGEEMVGFMERQRRTACEAALGALRPRFGQLPAYDTYGLLTADRLISWLTIGA